MRKLRPFLKNLKKISNNQQGVNMLIHIEFKFILPDFRAVYKDDPKERDGIYIYNEVGTVQLIEDDVMMLVISNGRCLSEPYILTGKRQPGELDFYIGADSEHNITASWKRVEEDKWIGTWKEDKENYIFQFEFID